MTDIVAQINDKNGRAEYDAALKLALNALKNNPDDYALQVAAGNAYYGLRDFAKAEQCYLAAAASCPQDAVFRSSVKLPRASAFIFSGNATFSFGKYER